MTAKIMSFFSDIGQSWYSTMLLCKPAELKTIFLLAINSLMRLYKNPYFWMIIAGFLATTLFAESYGLYFLLQPHVLFTIFMMPLLMLIRPSVDRKNFGYIFASKKTLLAAIVGAFLLCLDKISELACTIPVLEYGVTLVLFDSLAWIMSPVGIIWVFWMLDARPHMDEYAKTFTRTLKMVVYHLPFFVLVRLLLFVLEFPLVRLIESVHNVSVVLLTIMFLLFVMMVIVPLYCVLLSQGYVRFLRQEFKRYYEV